MDRTSAFKTRDLAPGGGKRFTTKGAKELVAADFVLFVLFVVHSTVHLIALAG